MAPVATIRLQKEGITILVLALLMFVDSISLMSTAESRALIELGNEWRCCMSCSASDSGFELTLARGGRGWDSSSPTLACVGPHLAATVVSGHARRGASTIADGCIRPRPRSSSASILLLARPRRWLGSSMLAASLTCMHPEGDVPCWSHST